MLAARPAKARWVIKGAGYGHGIGMSQYGAYGYAKKGTGYRAIVKHYYSGTEVGSTGSKTVRVLLRPYQSTVRFKGASAACGVSLAEKKTYSAKPKKSKVILRNKGGVRLANCGSVMSATGGASVSLIGKGAYRGAIEARGSSVPGKLNAINAVDLEDYIRGVIAEESPSSWPLDALKAQAVAARSYALSTGVGGNGFDHYDDTRSQVYGGIGAETARTNQAVVEHRGRGRRVQGQGRRDLLLLDLRRAHREQRVLLPRRHPAALPARGSRPLRRRLALPPLDPQALERPDAGRAGRPGARQAEADRRHQARRLAADREGEAGRHRAAPTKVSGPDLRSYLGLPDTWATFKREAEPYPSG